MKEADRKNRERKFIEWLSENKPEYKYVSGFIDKSHKVILYCKIHEKEFSVIPDYLKQNKSNCPDCSLLHKQVRDEQSRLSREQEFIDWLASNRPDYEYKCGFIGEKNEVILLCKKHNILFNILVSDLKYNSKICPVCKKDINLQKTIEDRNTRKEQFIEDSIKVWGTDKFDYSLVEFINHRTPVKIRCIEHDVVFEQIPSTHLLGQLACPICKKLKRYDRTERERVIFEKEFYKKAREVWGDDKFDYSMVEYINQRTPIKIRCIEHDVVFEQIPSTHLLGKLACPICQERQIQEKIDKQRIEYEKEFYIKAKEIHGDKYDYSLVEYINHHTPVKIYCKKHKTYFMQEPTNHLCGSGCPLCNESKLELHVKKILDDNNIVYEIEKKFDWLIYKRKQKLDFYLPDYNIAIECQGDQHFRPVNFSSDESKMFEQFEVNKARDSNKRKLCEEHGVPIIYIANKSYCNNITIFEISKLINQIEIHKNKKQDD